MATVTATGAPATTAAGASTAPSTTTAPPIDWSSVYAAMDIPASVPSRALGGGDVGRWGLEQRTTQAVDFLRSSPAQQALQNLFEPSILQGNLNFAELGGLPKVTEVFKQVPGFTEMHPDQQEFAVNQVTRMLNPLNKLAQTFAAPAPPVSAAASAPRVPAPATPADLAKAVAPAKTADPVTAPAAVPATPVTTAPGAAPVTPAPVPAATETPRDVLKLAGDIRYRMADFSQRLAANPNDAEALHGYAQLGTMVSAAKARSDLPISKLLQDVGTEMPAASAGAVANEQELNMAVQQKLLDPDAAIKPALAAEVDKRVSLAKGKSAKTAGVMKLGIDTALTRFTEGQRAHPRMAAAIAGLGVVVNAAKGAGTDQERQMYQTIAEQQVVSLGLLDAQLKAERVADGFRIRDGYGTAVGYDLTAILGAASFGLSTYQILVQDPKEAEAQRDFAVDMYKMQRDDNREDMRLQYGYMEGLKGAPTGETKSSVKIKSSRYKVRL